jgi:DNA-binding NarL/FixJ family response regulator
MHYDAPSDSRPRLMIADDDPVVLSSLGMLLGEAFEVVGVARDAVAAVELARETQPDAAIVDVEMPGGGGQAAVRGILAVSKETAIVVLSSDESDAVVRELILAGAMAYQRKGTDRVVLEQTLHDSITVRANTRLSPA